MKDGVLMIIHIYAKVSRDLMFRRFIDLSLSENMPDHSSIWRFRQLLNTEKLLEPLLEQINNHLEQNSIIVSLGSINIIDATVIEAKQSRKRKGKHGNNTQDPEAAYNVKTAADGKRKTTYGFKMHANTDEDGFVKKNDVYPWQCAWLTRIWQTTWWDLCINRDD